jgi:hypothetical protein
MCNNPCSTYWLTDGRTWPHRKYHARSIYTNFIEQSPVEKMIFSQLIKKFPALYGIRSFITVFTRARHWSLSWARWIQSTPSHRISSRSVLILSPTLRLSFQSGLLKENVGIWDHHAVCACASVFVSSSAWTNWPVFAKFGINVIPLEINSSFVLSISTICYSNMADVRTFEVEATLAQGSWNDVQVW